MSVQLTRNMTVYTFAVGALLTNCYVVSCEQTKEAIVIDPSFDDQAEAGKVFSVIDEGSLKMKLILNTHGHPDHTCGNGIVKDKFHMPILIHEYDGHMLGEFGESIAEFFSFKHSSPPADRLLRDGDSVGFGKIRLKVLHTPGHSRGSISLVGRKDVFTGDTLFMDSIGRTDFPESSETDMYNSLRKLAGLPDPFIVYPGHGPKTSIGKEKENNPFLRFL